MNFRTFAWIVSIALLLPSCAVTSKTETARSIGIYGPGVLQNPVMADLDVNEVKVTGNATGRKSHLAEVKNLAITDALKKANADVLIEPIFTVEINGSKVTAIVTGYPSVYKNFRSVTAADVPVLETGVMQTAKTSEVSEDPKKTKGTGAIIGAVIVVLTVVGFIVGGGL